MADEHGLLLNQQVSFDTMGSMLGALETGRTGALAPTLRMADDAFAGGACLVVSGPSSQSKAQVAEAMRRHACTPSGRPSPSTWPPSASTSRTCPPSST